MLAPGLASVMLLAVRVRLLPAVTGLGLAVKEPICGPAARKRARAKPPDELRTLPPPATTILPSASTATATGRESALCNEEGVVATPLAPKVASRIPVEL